MFSHFKPFRLSIIVPTYIACFLLLCGNSYGQLFHQNLQDKGLSYEQVVSQTEAHYKDLGIEKGNGFKQFQRWKYWSERNLNTDGKVRSDAAALRAHRNFKVTNTRNNQAAISGSYVELGPLSSVVTSSWSSALGRISAIGIDESDNDHIIIGSPTGGVWRTDDLGTNWTAIFDDQLLMDVFALEISHIDPDTYWVGIDGGLLISTNAGISWHAVGGISSGLFNTIEMHPDDPNIVFAVQQVDGRVWKSIDGGHNFVSVMQNNSYMYDLEFHPTNPDIIYASGNGAIYKSINKGDDFNKITSGHWSGASLNTMMMAVTPASPSNIYLMEEQNASFEAIYLSSDEGETWTTIASSIGYQALTQAPRDMDIIVSPIDPNIIHVGGLETWKSNNLGQNWTRTSVWTAPGENNFIHADIDILIYDDQRIVAGTDGGIYVSTDEANTWTDITSGLGIRQFYRIGASQTDLDRVSGGSQDNGTSLLKSGMWYDWLGADGMETFIDWSNPNIVYATIQYGRMYYSINGGQTQSTYGGYIESGNWVTPIEQDPINPNIIYTARNRVYKRVNNVWEVILDFGLQDKADEMKIAPSNNMHIYVSYGNTLYRTIDGGNNWNTTILPGSRVNYIVVHPLDPFRVAIALSGSDSKVMESLDGGASFQDITANIPPEVGIECVVYEEVQNGVLFCGGNPGIFYTTDTANPIWIDHSVNLPKVRVTELEIKNGQMYVGTYGRGLWKFSFDCDVSLAGTPCNDLDACTVNDILDNNCHCIGTYTDSDNDGVCDILDVCAGGDDGIDSDNDGTPDFCDSCADSCSDQDCDGVCDTDDICPNGDDTRDMDGDGVPDFCDACDDKIGTPCDDNDPCTFNDIYNTICACEGTFTDSDLDGVCDPEDICEGSDDNADVDSDGIPDGCDDCNELIETPLITLELKLDNYPDETSWRIQDQSGTILFSSPLRNYEGYEPETIIQKSFCSLTDGCYEFLIYDRYGDGICCLEGDGYYLLKHGNGDTISFGGDYGFGELIPFNLGRVDCGCEDIFTPVPGGIISSSNGTQQCTSFEYSLLQTDVSLLMSDIDSNTEGAASQRYEELVTISYRDEHGVTVTHGTFSTDWSTVIPGPLTFLTICIEDVDGQQNTPVQASITNIYSCEGTLTTLCFTEGICDDGNPCTINDQYQSDCSCIGVNMDSDGDGICNANDLCPGGDDTIDTDSDGIPDDCDDCLDEITHTANELVQMNQSAVLTISSNHRIPANGNVAFNAGQSIELTVDFTVEAGAVFLAYIETCVQ